MTSLVDLVNFNADASCLSTPAWLHALENGTDSALCRWLLQYVTLGRKTVLGFTGATIADLRAFNPDAIALVNAHPDVFEIIVRPFAHDISLLRSRDAFLLNLDLGFRLAKREFHRVTPFYLPPEFMLTNEQVALLAARAIDGVAVNAARFSSELQQRIPDEPYQVKGIGGTLLRCLPVQGALTQAYLDALHLYDASPWNDGIAGASRTFVVSWRDGESSFLLPDGLERERAWLEAERGVTRVHLTDIQVEYRRPDQLAAQAYQSYPVHSFTAWMKEFRMLGYVTRLQQIEQQLPEFDVDERALWLQAINSDVLSAVEKLSPVVTLKRVRHSAERADFVIHRSERGFEGEEYLVLLETLRRDRHHRDGYTRFLASGPAHARKLAARKRAIEVLGDE
jgi:hypothetical protein